MANDFISLRWGGKTFPDAAAGIDVFINQLRATWQGEARQAGKALREYLDHVASVLATRHGSPWGGPGPGGDTLSARTGKSVQSIIRSVKVTGTSWETLAGHIGGNPTLAIHEYGGTVRAKGKLLTVPLPAALSAQGTTPPFARQWKDTFVATSKAGNLIIFQKRGAGIVPLYVLVEEYTIKPRLGMRDELKEQVPYFLNRAVDYIARDFKQQLMGG